MADGEIKYENLRYFIIDFCIPYGLRVPDSDINKYNEKSYIVNIDELPVKINFKIIHDYRYKEDVGFQLKYNKAAKNDRHGLHSYSKVQVWFGEDVFSQKLVDKDWLLSLENVEILFRLAIDGVNKFIQEYRDLTRDFWIRPLAKYEVPAYTCRILSENGETSFMKAGNGEIDWEYFNKPKIISDDDVEKLRVKLLCQDYPFRAQIYLDALDFQSIEKNNISVLLAVTRFEHFVYSELKSVLSKNKLNKISKREECGCLKGITEVCTRGFLEIFDFDFESSQEWMNLRDNALRVRNKIVHGETDYEISNEDCHAALESVRFAEIYLHNYLFSTLPNYQFPKVRH